MHPAQRVTLLTSSKALQPPRFQTLGAPQGIIVFVFLGGGGDGPAFLIHILLREDSAGDVARPPYLIRPTTPLEWIRAVTRPPFDPE